LIRITADSLYRDYFITIFTVDRKHACVILSLADARENEREKEKEREREREGRKGISLFIADITEGCESYCGFIGRPLALVSDQSRVSTEIRSPD